MDRVARRHGPRAAGPHAGSQAGKEVAVPKGAVQQVGLVEVGPVGRCAVFQSLGFKRLLCAEVGTGETVADAEQGLLVADAKVGVGVLGKRGRCDERNLEEDRVLDAVRGKGRTAVGEFAAVVVGEDVLPGTAADGELVAGGTAGEAFGGHPITSARACTGCRG